MSSMKGREKNGRTGQMFGASTTEGGTKTARSEGMSNEEFIALLGANDQRRHRSRDERREALGQWQRNRAENVEPEQQAVEEKIPPGWGPTVTETYRGGVRLAPSGWSGHSPKQAPQPEPTLEERQAAAQQAVEASLNSGSA